MRTYCCFSACAFAEDGEWCVRDLVFVLVGECSDLSADIHPRLVAEVAELSLKQRVRFTIWGSMVDRFGEKGISADGVFLVRGVKVKKYNGGLETGVSEGGEFVTEHESLSPTQRWWSSIDDSEKTSLVGATVGGAARSYRAASVEAMKNEILSLGDEQEACFLLEKVEFSRFSGSLHYPGCMEKIAQGRVCSKEIGYDGICPRCEKSVVTRAMLRLVKGTFVQAGNVIKVTAFGDVASKILGITAADSERLEKVAERKGDGKRMDLQAAVEPMLGKEFDLKVAVVQRSGEYSMTAYDAYLSSESSRNVRPRTS